MSILIKCKDIISVIVKCVSGFSNTVTEVNPAINVNSVSGITPMETDISPTITITSP